MMRNLSSIPRTYVVLVLDCCRSQMAEQHRGSLAEEPMDPVDTAQNLIVTYGCAPSSTTPAKSTISVALFERLREKAEDATGEVVLPNALIGWRGTDGHAETQTLSDVEFRLKFEGWVPKNPIPVTPAGGALDSQIAELRATLQKQMTMTKANEKVASSQMTMQEAAERNVPFVPDSQVTV